MRTKRIGIIGFDGVTALDIAGPSEAFAAATMDEVKGKPEPCYEIVVLGISARRFAAESGIMLAPHYSLERAPELDTLTFPAALVCVSRKQTFEFPLGSNLTRPKSNESYRFALESTG
jgi:hypothetical protein